jgi:zinc protease
MKFRTQLIIVITVVVIFLSDNTYSQEKGKIPVDPDIKYGKFENGLTYYIRKNVKPEKRLELRLAVRTGSINEDNDQKGLAHFCEHMAFNGTKNFPKQDLVNYLESIGVDFGSDLNASTSYDQTIYKLKVPTDNPEALEKGFQVLEDWAHNVTYDDAEIDKERGVILEEWRLRKGAEDRIWHKQMPVLYYNSHYAERDVIGDTAVFLHAPCDAFRRYYHDWYRPDLMAVIVVGDMDADQIYEKINNHFAKLTMPANPRKREEYSIPSHKDVLVSVESDKELSFPSVDIYFKYPGRDNGTYESFYTNYVENLASIMLSNRMTELSRKPNPPFNFPRGFFYNFEGDKRCFNMSCMVKGADAITAYTSLLTEAIRASQHGFTTGELDRAKASTTSNIQRTYNERDKTESGRLVSQYIFHYLRGNAIPGFDKSYELGMKEVPLITLEEVNRCIKNIITSENVVILVSMPEKEGFTKPSGDEIKQLFNDIFNRKLDPYIDDASDKPLFQEKLTPGTVASLKELKEAAAVEWKLSNGARVILKPTDFKNDNIAMAAYSYGGEAMAKTEDYYAINYAASLIDECGLGDFSSTQLTKKLAGKIVRVSPNIGWYSEGFYGSSSATDFETMLQLINLYFTRPRKDDDAFKAYKEKEIAETVNSKNRPETTFYDSMTVNLYRKHFWIKPTDEELVKKMDLEKSFTFFKDRISDASDFTFFFVGSFKTDVIKPMVEKYIASLPSSYRKEEIKDAGVRYTDKSMVKKVNKGIEQKSSVAIRITGDVKYSPLEKYLISSLSEVLDIRLREVVREDLGGTYGIYANGNISKQPASEYIISIGWGCNPERVDELTNAVKKVLGEIRTNGIDTSYINKVKEIQKRRFEVNIKDNDRWLNMLYTCYYNQEDPKDILINETYRQKLTAEQIQSTAQKYLNDQSMMIFEMFPESWK